jgi:transcriptional regulator with XRE-family HTH domain
LLREVIGIETLGERIKRIRKLNEMNQIEFSSRIGISQSTLSEMELDKYKPSVEIIISIVSEFPTDLKWLILGTADEYLDSVNDGVSGTFINKQEIDVIRSWYEELSINSPRHLEEVDHKTYKKITKQRGT